MPDRDNTITLTIDNRTVTVPKGTTVLAAAASIGRHIPTMCFDARLTPVGGCRLCQVEVEGIKGGLVTACNQVAFEGMVVRTDSQAAHAARQEVVELMLVHHPLDCPICDKGGECTLQNETIAENVQQGHYRGARKRWPEDSRSGSVHINPNLCVLCNRCVQLCDELIDVQALKIGGNGIYAHIGAVDPTVGLQCDDCGMCVTACPVGALGDQLYRFTGRPWDFTRTDVTCPHCNDGCRVTVHSLENKVARINNSAYTGPNRGAVCNRATFGYDDVNHPERLTTPLLRKNGTLLPATWGEALDAVAEQFKAAQKPVALGSDRLACEDWLMWQRLDLTFVANTDRALAPALAAAGGVLGRQPITSQSMQDVGKADLIFTLHANIAETQPVLGYAVKQAIRHQGAAYLACEDHNHRMHRRADHDLTATPGSEGVLLAGLVNLLIGTHGKADPGGLLDATAAFTVETVAAQTGISGQRLQAAAQALANAQNPALLTTIERDPARDTCVEAAWLAALAQVLGFENNLWIMGEGGNALGSALLKPTVADPAGAIAGADLLWVAGSDPAFASPWGAAFGAFEGFLVVQDLFLSDTAARADVVLPVAGPFERRRIALSLNGRLTESKAAVPPVGQSRPDWQVFYNVGRRLGLCDDLSGEGQRWCWLESQHPAGWPAPVAAEAEAEAVIVAATVESAAPPAPTVAAQQGLILSLGGALHRVGSASRRWRSVQTMAPAPSVTLNPADAADLGIGDGDRVLLNGAVELIAHIDDAQRRGSAFVPQVLAEGQILGGGAITIEPAAQASVA
ncbi:MAG: hypothetical protein COX57_05000 [Alphaproteobacteria bacterium CG_4_10_14_0_2_um_filter_63_37]|nr:MAG: hypothetical protein AUJ55_01855 [Proteobacteria bacterium CG1_02_64_396]PJA25127.1 MAG: hypothetical protein COX57_05000 [Alphaproteobacteria bacterium CG_4_10_14_0_2_um_filter_63_37]